MEATTLEAYLCDGERKYHRPMVKKLISSAQVADFTNATKAMVNGEPAATVLKLLIGNIKRELK